MHGSTEADERLLDKQLQWPSRQFTARCPITQLETDVSDQSIVSYKVNTGYRTAGGSGPIWVCVSSRRRELHGP